MFVGTPAIQRGRADDDIPHSLAGLTSYREVCRAIRQALFGRSSAKWRTVSPASWRTLSEITHTAFFVPA
jgi:hypothetical protein